MVTAGVGGVRVWNVRSLEEVLRVDLPGLVCCCCCVTPSLSTIITGNTINCMITGVHGAYKFQTIREEKLI